jgi:hypothetical protein
VDDRRFPGLAESQATYAEAVQVETERDQRGPAGASKQVRGFGRGEHRDSQVAAARVGGLGDATNLLGQRRGLQEGRGL